MFWHIVHAILFTTLSAVALHLQPAVKVSKDVIKPWTMARNLVYRDDNNRTTNKTIMVISRTSNIVKPDEEIIEGEICVPASVGGDSLWKDKNFSEQLFRGMDAASAKSIIMAGLIRNIGHSIKDLFRALTETGANFMRYHIIVIENDSTDGTKERLPLYCNSKKVTCFPLYLPTLHNEAQHLGTENRVRYLTVLRQSLLDEVRYFASKSKSSWDYVLMFDGDIFEGGSSMGFSPAAIYALLGLHRNKSGLVVADDPLDLVCANSINAGPKLARYRDTFALREHAWNEQVNTEELFNDKTAVWFTGNELEHVKSCFSGLALYSFKALQKSKCNYEFVSEDVCEHVSLNQCLDKKGFDDTAIYPVWTVTFEPHKQSCHDTGTVHWSTEDDQ